MRLCFFPAFEDADTLADHYYRLQWYLSPFRSQIAHVDMPVVRDELQPGPRPDYLDAGLDVDAGALPVAFPECDGDRLTACLGDADAILIWDSTAPLGADRRELFNAATVLRVDHQRLRFAGSNYLRARTKLAGHIKTHGQQYLERSQAAFHRFLARCQADICYVFGTGPGLAEAANHDFSDGVSIACNSMVRNLALLDRLRPSAIAVGDPIFHAGPSTYAGDFRRDLVTALDRYDAALIIPMRDVQIYSAYLPERFSDRTIAIPFKHGAAPNLGLPSPFHVTTTSNILTLFLLPIAARLAGDIRIFGCDGRPLEESDYFWRHDQASQLNDRMDDIRRAHPAFFDIDYNDYYLEHCQTLETWISRLEAAGKRITNHTFSHIPALARRTATGRERAIGPSDADTDAMSVSIIMPALNADRFLREAIASVRAQSHTHWELLIIDDGSTDETVAIANEQAALDDRIRVLHNPGRYQWAARNHGFDAACGDYVCFLDADDTMQPNSLRARLRTLYTLPGVRLVHGIVNRMGDTGEDLGSPLAKTSTVSFADMHANPFHINGVMGDIALFRENRLTEEVRSGEDWMMMARILRQGHKSVYVPETVANWRFHGASSTHRDIDSHEAALETTLRWIYGPCAPGATAPQYAAGLSHPPFDAVRQERKAGILARALVGARLQAVRAQLHQQARLEGFEAEPKAFWASQLRNAAIRHLRRPANALPTLPVADREKIARVAMLAGINSRLPQLHAALLQVFGLTGSTLAPVWRRGPCLIDRGAIPSPVNPELDAAARLTPSTGDHTPHWLAIGAVDADQRALIERAGHTVSTFGDAEATVTEETARTLTGHALKAHLDALEEARVDGLHIAAAGHEHAIVRGLPWNRARPSVIACRYRSDDRSADRLGGLDIAERLHERGYATYISAWGEAGTPASDTPQWQSLHIGPSPAARLAQEGGYILGFQADPGPDAVRAALG